MVATTIMRSFKGRDAKELFYNLGVFILVAFVTKLLESFREIMVVGDWMAFLMGCKQLGGLLMQSFQELVQSRVEDFLKECFGLVNLYKIRTVVALLLYMSYTCISSINAYWSNSNTIYKPMEFITKYRFLQINRYFHISELDKED